ncbi:MAG: DMT family transporter [Actinomycetota bacterium]|nr:DMT family transporter [Actinomycetota bacterium]
MDPGRRIQRAAERRPVALVGAGVFLFALGPVLVAGAHVSGPVLSFWRLWFGAGLMGVASAVYVRATGRRPSRRGWGWAAACGLAFAGHQLFFMSSIRMTSVVDVTLMQVLAPLIVAVLAAPMFGERPGVRFRAWSMVAIVGAAVVALGGSAGPDGDPAGIAFAALNVLFFAIYFVWSKQARAYIDVVPFLFGTVVVAAVVVSAFLVAAGDSPWAATGSDLVAAVAIAILPGALGHFVSTWPLRWVPANVPPLLQLAIPFIAGLLAWAFLGQGITWAHVVGGLLTIVGAAGAIRSPAGRRMVAREQALLAAGTS